MFVKAERGEGEREKQRENERERESEREEFIYYDIGFSFIQRMLQFII